MTGRVPDKRRVAPGLFFWRLSVGPPRQDRDEWVSGAEARRLAGVTYFRLQRSAILGLVKTRALPGEPIEFHRGDVLRLGQSRRRPAGTRRANP
jgi:hypothetical protein